MTEPISKSNRQRLLVMVFLFLAAMIALHGFFIWQVRNGLRKGYQDFTIFYCAGKIVNLGLGNQLYSDKVQWQVQQSFAPWVAIRKGPLPYNHPPFEALFFTPFAKLPFFAAFMCWDLLGVGLLCLLPFIVRPYVAIFHKVHPLWFVFLALAFFPVCVALIQGQDAILMLSVFTFTYIALKRDSDFWAGCILGIGLFRFHQVLPFLVILLLCRRFKAGVGFVLSCMFFTMLSVWLVGWHGLATYPAYLWQVESVLQRGPVVPLDMPTVRGFLYATLSPYLGLALIQSLTVVLSVGLIVLAAVKWRSFGGRKNLDLSFSVALISSFLVSYHAYVYELSSLLLVILLLANYAYSTRQTTWGKRLTLYAPVVLLFFTPLQMFLCLRYVQFHLFTLVLLIWAWGISNAISDWPGSTKTSSPRPNIQSAAWT